MVLIHQFNSFIHVTPILSGLHWLPIDARVRYKIAVLTFKAITTNKPSYLAELVSTHTPARELRSSLRRPHQLHVNRVRTAFGSRAFCQTVGGGANPPPFFLNNSGSRWDFEVRFDLFLWVLNLRTSVVHPSKNSRWLPCGAV